MLFHCFIPKTKPKSSTQESAFNWSEELGNSQERIQHRAWLWHCPHTGTAGAEPWPSYGLHRDFCSWDIWPVGWLHLLFRKPPCCLRKRNSSQLRLPDAPEATHHSTFTNRKQMKCEEFSNKVIQKKIQKMMHSYSRILNWKTVMHLNLTNSIQTLSLFSGHE